jgi:hypothetical protein
MFYAELGEVEGVTFQAKLKTLRLLALRSEYETRTSGSKDQAKQVSRLAGELLTDLEAGRVIVTEK